MSGPFPNLPERWAVSRLDRLATVNARIGWKALTADEYVPEGYAFLSTPNIKASEIDFENVNYISTFRYNESPELRLARDDVLLAKDGSTLGIVNIVRDLPRAATVNGSIAVLRSSNIYPNYLRYVIASRPMQEHIQALKDGMGVPHLFQRDIKRFPMPVPPLEEQRRIADFLDAETSTVDRLVASRRRQLTLLGERLRARVMESTGRLAVRGAAATQEWQRLPLRRVVASIKTGSTPSGGVDGTWAAPEDTGVLPWYTPSEIDEWMNLAPPERFVHDGGRGERGTARFEPGAVLVVCVGESIGKTVFLDHAASGNQQLTAVQPCERVDGRFLAWQLWGASQEIRESSPYTRVRIINGGDLLSFPVAAPPRPVQVAVRKELDIEAGRLMTLRDSLTRFTAGLSERRQALITAAVTGQIDVTTARGVEVS